MNVARMLHARGMLAVCMVCAGCMHVTCMVASRSSTRHLTCMLHVHCVDVIFMLHPVASMHAAVPFFECTLHVWQRIAARSSTCAAVTARARPTSATTARPVPVSSARLASTSSARPASASSARPPSGPALSQARARLAGARVGSRPVAAKPRTARRAAPTKASEVAQRHTAPHGIASHRTAPHRMALHGTTPQPHRTTPRHTADVDARSIIGECVRISLRLLHAACVCLGRQDWSTSGWDVDGTAATPDTAQPDPSPRSNQDPSKSDGTFDGALEHSIDDSMDRGKWDSIGSYPQDMSPRARQAALLINSVFRWVITT